MIKIITVVGARPQFIKLAPLSKYIQKKYIEIIVHTGQHYDLMMSRNFFEDLGINNPKYNLNVGSDTHGNQIGNMLIGLEQIYSSEKPDLVIVFGDTNTTLAGALAAVKLNIPVLHVESGLRSFNRRMPEEINRIATDHISDFLFAPTEAAMTNLTNEGLADKSYLTGDIMVDALKSNLDRALGKSNILEELGLNEKKYYLLTLHRPYNVDDPFRLKKILQKLGGLDEKIVFPVHPRTEKMIKKNDVPIMDNIVLNQPVGYLDFICLEYFSKKILTDSGGIQKEAYILEKPCITLRPETEWIETLEQGWNTLLQLENEKFVDIIRAARPVPEQRDIFGSGVGKKMMSIIQHKILSDTKGQ
jgi:UDP-N-acetylglucosamine 2-epimerase